MKPAVSIESPEIIDRPNSGRPDALPLPHTLFSAALLPRRLPFLYLFPSPPLHPFLIRPTILPFLDSHSILFLFFPIPNPPPSSFHPHLPLLSTPPRLISFLRPQSIHRPLSQA